jgi:hypothetical protein
MAFPVLDFPLVMFLVSLAVMAASAWLGELLRRRRAAMTEGERDDFGVVRGAALSLLALIVGFSFSMALARYDQRKTLEEGEANAIGTEFLRADFLPPDAGAKVRVLLRRYADQRVQYYEQRDAERLDRLAGETAATQAELWEVVRVVGTLPPNPLNALVAAGMNDVLNAQGYTQAAWWNRLPPGAWILMIVVAACCNVLIGYGRHRSGVGMLLVTPVTFALAFFLIADIDSPRAGVIRVQPQNLISLVGSLGR